MNEAETDELRDQMRGIRNNGVTALLIEHDIPDQRLGEVGYAFIDLEENQSADAAELTAFCRKMMADYKVPRFFEFVAEFPKTTTGKIPRSFLMTKAAQSVEASRQNAASAV